jgi:Haem-binding domain
VKIEINQRGEIDPRPHRRARRRAILAGAAALALGAATVAPGCSSQSAQSAAPAAQAGPANAVTSDPAVKTVLVDSCYDCHSERGDAPWNARLAPSYWFAGSAREKLDFSQWHTYSPQRRKRELTAIAKVVKDREMPPWDYKLFHPSASLDAAQSQTVDQWADKLAAALPAH